MGADNGAHVKGITGLKRSFGSQAAHKLTFHSFADPYPEHFNHAFFSEQEVIACISSS